MSLKITFVVIISLYSISSDIERSDSGFRAEFSVINKGRLFEVLIYRDNISLGECLNLCIQYLECESVNYNEQKNGQCELADQVFDDNEADTGAVGWLNYATPKRVDGAYSGWLSSPCSLTCGDKGVIIQRRLCNQPEPRYGGMKCQGESYREIACGKQIPCPDDTWDRILRLIRDDTAIKRMHKLFRIPAGVFPDEYQISFDVKLNSYEPMDTLKSIVVFKDDIDGQHIRIGVTAQSVLRCTVIVDQKKANFDSDIPLHQWFSIDIIQQKKSLGYTTDIYLNKTLAKTFEFKKTAIWKNDVAIYATTNPVPDGSLRNFFFNSGRKPMIFNN